MANARAALKVPALGVELESYVNAGVFTPWSWLTRYTVVVCSTLAPPLLVVSMRYVKPGGLVGAAGCGTLFHWFNLSLNLILSKPGVCLKATRSAWKLFLSAYGMHVLVKWSRAVSMH